MPHLPITFGDHGGPRHAGTVTLVSEEHVLVHAAHTFPPGTRLELACLCHGHPAGSATGAVDQEQPPRGLLSEPGSMLVRIEQQNDGWTQLAIVARAAAQ